ncbi:hypothetical protein J2W28_005334 [Variovorax boronicumulans]|uniref:Uncharacterized protein n=1 Tax=Variovorax paradoxus (strain EPS) TaxID=595537 RepID=E6UVH9_VARPE|nr:MULTISPECIES: hypothetical protein [Variovorax]ADU39844.1 hypothetical protein Varpa_5691 [Variovorax paradoxus EPS]MDP9994864.1 hypothetical protein [Variovorax boronicumulans]MDQ0006164.1 hypothetical protein [Variovorax boronicumulans]
MVTDLFHALLALAALFVPLGFAWWALSRTARRHEAKRRKGGPMR